MARTFYGGGGGELITTPDVDGDLQATVALFDMYDAREGGSQVSDLTDLTGNAITQVEPDEYGVLEFYGPDSYSSVLWAEDASGSVTRRYRINPVGADVGPAGPQGPAGPAGADGPAGAAGADGASGVSGATYIKFRQEGEASLAVNLLPEVVPFPFTVDGGIGTVSAAPTGSQIQIDFLRDGNSFWADPADRPTIPKDKKVSALAIPDSVGPFPAMTRLSMNVTEVGDATSTALTPTLKGYLTGDSGGGSATSFTIPTTGYLAPDGVTPVSIAAGDGMVIFIDSGQSAGLPGGFATALATEASATNMKGSLAYRTALGTSADGGTVTLGTGSPYSYKIALVSNPGGTEGVLLTAPAAGSSATSSALVTTGTDALGLWFAGFRATNGAQPTIAISGGAAPTEVVDTVTTRTGTNTNFGSVLAYKAIPTATTETATTYTASVGGGSTQWVQAVVAIQSGVGAGSPGENVTGTLWIREYVDPEVGGGD